MKKKILRATAVLISVCTFLLLFSCASEQSKENVPEYDSSAQDYDSLNLNGYEFTFAASTHGSNYPLDPSYSDEVRGDKLLQRYRETESKFNVKINVINGCDMGTYMTKLASGQKYADIMLAPLNNVFPTGYIQNGYFQPFSDMDIDLDSGLYGTPSIIEAGTFLGEAYGIVAYYWGIPVSDTAPAMWFNPVTLANFSQPSPHELDEQGVWNWETLEDICAKVFDESDPDKNNHVHAMAYTSEPYLELSAIYSNNGRIAQIGDDGKLYYTLNSPNVIEAMEFLSHLKSVGYIIDGGDRQNITPFVEDRYAFFMEYTHLSINSESDSNLSYLMDHEYEWINFPIGPRGDENTLSTAISYHSRLFYSPINAPTDISELLLPFMFQPLPGETVETWQDDFRSVNFYSDRSFEYFVKIRDNAFFDYSPYTPFTGDITNALLKITRGTSTAAEALEQIESVVQSSLDRLYNDYVK